MPTRSLSLCLALILTAASAPAQQDFVNWETPHVHPLELTPNGDRLLAVNTADNRLEVFDTTGAGGGLTHVQSIAVGLDPVSVRALGNAEAWVVNQVSDSVSIVDLVTGRVRRTLATDDEPCDVVFTESPGRAFVSCSQANSVLVYRLSDLAAAPTRLKIDGEDPRAMATSPDGSKVYVAIFESGNGSTILGGGGGTGTQLAVVDLPGTPYGGQNPPPNDGNAFKPPIDGALPTPPRVSLIVKKNDQGQWLDDNGADWTPWVSGAQAHESARPVGWDLVDHDVAEIDVDTLAVDYHDRLMNVCMAMAVHPVSGSIAVVGTDATNEVRYEPNLAGRFLRVNLALVDPALPSKSVVDLNQHLDYTTSIVPLAERELSLGDPRGIAWSGGGQRAYVTGMGSNNMVVLNPNGDRRIPDPVEVGEGPTGVVVHDGNNRVYVLNKFEASVSIVNMANHQQIEKVPFFDPTPPEIKVGRKHLYNTRATSGLGHIACASCHVDGRFDRLAWDLGDPRGAMKPVAGLNLGAGLGVLGAGFQPIHPMKGPRTTQTLQDIIGKEPFHWQGDKDGLEDFNGAFVSLQGDNEVLTPQEMQEFEDFLASIHYPPNPFRNFDNSLPTDLPLPDHFTSGRFAPAGQPMPNGNAQRGLDFFRPPFFVFAPGAACSTCHTLPTGLGTDATLVGSLFEPLPPGPNGERHHAVTSLGGTQDFTMKVPHLRNIYEKVGFDTTQPTSRAGFGFAHQGVVDSVTRFVSGDPFTLGSDQDVADFVALLLAFTGSDLPTGALDNPLEPPGTPSQDAHAAVGRQVTLVDADAPEPGQLAEIAAMLALADAGKVGVVARGRRGGLVRGHTYIGGGQFLSDRASESVSAVALADGATFGQEMTFTVVPLGSEMRIGIDRDMDGAYDRDEWDANSDPADAGSSPSGCSTAAATDLGYGLPGSGGKVPRYRACGSLHSSGSADFYIEDAAPGVPAFLVISTQTVYAPFNGGVLVPRPDLIIGPTPTGDQGDLYILNVPGGQGPVDLYEQWIFLDPGAPFGRSMSNALAIHFDP